MRALILILFLFGCAQSPQVEKTSTFAGNSMTIPFRIVVGKNLSSDEKVQVNRLIEEVFQEINQIHNKWNPDSEISYLNRLSAYEKTPISSQLESLINLSDQIYHLSEKRFDPTIETIQNLFREKLAQHQFPEEEEIAPFLPALGWHHIHIENHQFWKDHPLTQIDLSGIAKGLAVDMLVERLKKAGYPDAFVEWGGEIRANGAHPDDRPWNIFISRLGDPNPQNAIDTLSLNNQAVATSGDYEQFWSVNEEQFCHILDPKTGRPRKITETSITSATVLAHTCAFADGLATTALLFDTLEEAKQWSEKITLEFPFLSFWFITHQETTE